jgi:arginine-tRNA-protein transferase
MMGIRDQFRNLRLFVTAEHPCSYLAGRLTRNLVTDPGAVDNGVYAQLAKLGFRRSGSHVYRPHCTGCEECLSLRIPVLAFRPDRVQRRTWNKNFDLTVDGVPPYFNTEHYKLFKRYVKARHADGGMDNTTPEGYLAFITSPWSATLLYEFRLDSRLLAVAVTDRFDDGLSAVYTFFDPEQSARSLGTQVVLWQIAEARRQALQWVYLGYWVRESEKMAYKANFKPHEIFMAGRWISMPR